MRPALPDVGGIRRARLERPDVLREVASDGCAPCSLKPTHGGSQHVVDRRSRARSRAPGNAPRRAARRAPIPRRRRPRRALARRRRAAPFGAASSAAGRTATTGSDSHECPHEVEGRRRRLARPSVEGVLLAHDHAELVQLASSAAAASRSSLRRCGSEATHPIARAAGRRCRGSWSRSAAHHRRGTDPIRRRPRDQGDGTAARRRA